MPQINNYTLTSACDGVPLSVCEVLPDGAPKALVQLAHGMSEHKERYLPFMQFLAAHGFAAIINDHRGHGASLKSPDDLGYFYKGGSKALVDDLHQVTLHFRAQHPKARLFLFGHSMGSLAVRVYRQRYEGDIDALVVCGSPGQSAAVNAGLLLNRVMTAVRGERYVSKLFAKMTTGSFNKGNPRDGSSNAWLSTDADVVRAYDADPLCGFPFTLNGYRALLELMRDAYAPVPAINAEMPVHFISGEDDPCAPDRAGFEAAVQCLRDDGYRHVTARMFPGVRHEALNQPKRQLVYDDLLDHFDVWLQD